MIKINVFVNPRDSLIYELWFSLEVFKSANTVCACKHWGICLTILSAHIQKSQVKVSQGMDKRPLHVSFLNHFISVWQLLHHPLSLYPPHLIHFSCSAHSQVATRGAQDVKFTTGDRANELFLSNTSYNVNISSPLTGHPHGDVCFHQKNNFVCWKGRVDSIYEV